jgi:hypothetical protein
MKALVSGRPAQLFAAALPAAPSSQRERNKPSPAGALWPQMSANQGHGPCESASRVDFVATPTFRCQEKANVNSPGNE